MQHALAGIISGEHAKIVCIAHILNLWALALVTKPNLLPKLLSNLEKVISQSERVFELETQKTKKIEKLKSAILTHELQSEAE